MGLVTLSRVGITIDITGLELARGAMYSELHFKMKLYSQG